MRYKVLHITDWGGHVVEEYLTDDPPEDGVDIGEAGAVIWQIVLDLEHDLDDLEDVA